MALLQGTGSSICLQELARSWVILSIDLEIARRGSPGVVRWVVMVVVLVDDLVGG